MEYGVWSIGYGINGVDLWNPKYASHVFKVTVAVDILGNIVWICPLAPGSSGETAMPLAPFCTFTSRECDVGLTPIHTCPMEVCM